MLTFSQKYFELLNNDYKSINLTRINNFDDFYNKQILDSIIPLTESEIFYRELQSTKRLVDIGFGGGFPILPLAFKCPDYQFYGFESRAKKVKVVSDIAQKLSLKNVSLYHYRIENILLDLQVTCTFKAVGKVYDFLSKINNATEITVFFYKGPNFYELEREQLIMCKNQWDIIEEKEFEVEGTEKRLLIGFKSKNNVLRGTNDSSKLVKLSQLK